MPTQKIQFLNCFINFPACDEWPRRTLVPGEDEPHSRDLPQTAWARTPHGQSQVRVKRRDQRHPASRRRQLELDDVRHVRAAETNGSQDGEESGSQVPT